MKFNVFGPQVDFGERRTSFSLQRSGAKLGGCGAFQVSPTWVVDILLIFLFESRNWTRKGCLDWPLRYFSLFWGTCMYGCFSFVTWESGNSDFVASPYCSLYCVFCLNKVMPSEKITSPKMHYAQCSTHIMHKYFKCIKNVNYTNVCGL